MLDIFYYDKGIKKAKPNDLLKLKGKGVWVDCFELTKDEADLLKQSFKLHPLTVEDLLSVRTRVKIEEFSNYLFGVFYGISKKKELGMLERDFVLGRNFLISNHVSKIDFYETIKEKQDRLENLFNKGMDFLFHKLLDMEIDNYFPVLDSLDDSIEKIEESVTEKPSHEMMIKILDMKRALVNVKRVVFPQRERISSLTKGDNKFLSENSRPYFRDIYDHAIRVSDTIENYREAIGNTFDVYMSAVSNNMNEVMKTLSIIATIALPLTVVSGIYGTNFSVLPGQANPFGFWIMVGVMALMCVFMIVFFRKRGWF